MSDDDLFSWRARYPDLPGTKAPGTSTEAADSIASEAETLRKMAYAELQRDELTADEVAERLGRSILSIRPRLSELRAKERIQDTGKRRLNLSGKRAIVWRAAQHSFQPAQ